MVVCGGGGGCVWWWWLYVVVVVVVVCGGGIFFIYNIPIALMQLAVCGDFVLGIGIGIVQTLYLHVW